MSFLVISNILVSTYQYIDTSDGGGSAIHCLVDKALRKKYQSMINTFCWINSTFTLPKYHEEIVLPGMPGVGKSLFHTIFVCLTEHFSQKRILPHPQVNIPYHAGKIPDLTRNTKETFLIPLASSILLPQ